MKHSIHSALVLAAALFWGGWDWLQHPDKDVEQGNAAFAAKDYQGALDAYAAARETNGDTPRIHYDMGAALYKLAENTQAPAARVDLYARAERAFRQAAGTPDLTLRSLAHYNLGNTLARLGHYEKAVHAYKQALRANPLNDDARHNLELVQRRLRPDHEQTPPQGQGPGSSGQDSPGQDASGQDSPGQDASGQDASGQDASGQDTSGQDTSGQDASGQNAPGQDGQPGDASEAPGPGSDVSGSGEPDAQKDNPGQSGQDQGSSSTGQSRSGQAGKSPAQPDQGSGSANTADADARGTPDNPPGSSGNNSGRPTGASKDRSGDHESTGDVNKKLDALERMSRELRRNKLRNSATQSRRHASGKDW